MIRFIGIRLIDPQLEQKFAAAVAWPSGQQSARPRGKIRAYFVAKSAMTQRSAGSDDGSYSKNTRFHEIKLEVTLTVHVFAKSK
jgi:hypothetical protein